MMRPLDLNLATRPYSNNTLVWTAYIGLLAGAVFFSYWNVSSYRHYRAELAALDLEQGNMEQERTDLAARHGKILRDVRQFDRVSINRRTAKANEVIEWRAFSWTRLFNRLEEVLPNNIKMTSIRPIFRGRDRETEIGDSRPSMPVKVEGLARDWDSLFELETDLIDDPSFGRVLPRNIDKRDNGELAFSIEFTYYPDEPVPTDAPADPEQEVAEVAPEALDEAAAAGTPPVASSAATEAPAEVVDEWAEQVTDEAAAADTPAAGDQPGRRTLPRVEPEPDDDDGEGE